MDSGTIRRYLSARRLKVTAKDKRVQRASADHPGRAQFIDAKLTELRNRKAA